MNMAWVCDAVELMQLAFYLDEVHLNQEFKCNSKLSLYKCHSYVFTYTEGLGWFVMHETGTDGQIEFFWSKFIYKSFNLELQINFYDF